MIRAERLDDVTPPPIRTSPGVVDSYVQDASGMPAGHAEGLVRPVSEAEAAAFLRVSRERGSKILPQAARTSLTGGATPRGEVVVSVEGLCDTGPVEPSGRRGRATFGAGVRLRELQAHVGASGYYYPPVPTYQEAMIGGVASTNAGGAATFKYGVTREWIRGLRVLLFNGDVLSIERGQATAPRGRMFRIALSDGDELEVPVPAYRLPALKKMSAGYFAADLLDLVDLFVGSEGTLGLITAVTVELVPAPPATLTGLVFCPDVDRALALACEVRRAAHSARERGDAAGPDVRAIEWLDPRCLDILRRHDEARRRRVRLPDDARAGVLFEMELDEPADADLVAERLTAALNGGGTVREDGLIRLFRILRAHDVLDALEFALPEDSRRHAALCELREAVPQRVVELLAGRAGVLKTAGDLIVPFDHLPEMMRVYAEGFERRGLDYAVWGHFGDGNLHPNALPRDPAEAERAVEALFEFATEAIRRGGCPLSEHGVGRNPVKQRMLRAFLGDAAIAEMRNVRRALDPEARFAPGVLFAG